MSLFFPYYNEAGHPNVFPRRTEPRRKQEDPLAVFFRDLNKTAELLNKAATNSTIYNRLKEIDNTPFDNLVSSDENNVTYIINVPEGVTQNDVSIDVTNSNKTLIVEVEKEHDNGSIESYRHARTTHRDIDIDNIQAHLDTEKSQIVIEIPFVIQDEALKPEEETLIPLTVRSSKEGQDKEADSQDENESSKNKNTENASDNAVDNLEKLNPDKKGQLT